MSTVKPSEMVAGLDQVVKRAEKVEAREEAKRRSGGKLNANLALLTDDTGRRWTRMVRLGITAVVLAVMGFIGLIVWLEARKPVNPRAQRAQTERTLAKLLAVAATLPGFKDGEEITPQKAKDAFTTVIDAQIKSLDDQIAAGVQTADNRWANRNKILKQDQDEWKELRKLEDAWHKPLVFTIDTDIVKIACSTNPGAGLAPLDPITFSLRAGKQAPPPDAPPPPPGKAGE
ncbi:MAG TPA: hypothetical protein VGP72_15545 [Planctomycetota bacterium]|jgi:hypothetical protein